MFKYNYGGSSVVAAIIILLLVLAVNAAGLFVAAYIAGRGLVAAGL